MRPIDGDVAEMILKEGIAFGQWGYEAQDILETIQRLPTLTQDDLRHNLGNLTNEGK